MKAHWTATQKDRLLNVLGKLPIKLSGFFFFLWEATERSPKLALFLFLSP